MNFTPTWAQVTVFLAIVSGFVCTVVAVITSAILAVGWVVNWLIPSLPFEFASIVAGIAMTIAAFVLHRVAIVLSERLSPPQVTYEDEDDDDYEFDEEMADRIAELTVARLTRPPVEKKYTAKARRK